LQQLPFKVDGVQELPLSLYSNEEPSYEGKRMDILEPRQGQSLSYFFGGFQPVRLIELRGGSLGNMNINPRRNPTQTICFFQILEQSPESYRCHLNMLACPVSGITSVERHLLPLLRGAAPVTGGPEGRRLKFGLIRGKRVSRVESGTGTVLMLFASVGSRKLEAVTIQGARTREGGQWPC
jgi:hypothetical protein